MKKQIWKFDLIVSPYFKVEMPKGSVFVSVQSQNNRGVMWAIVNTEAEKETRTFSRYGNGHSMPSDGINYSGRYKEKDNGVDLVWH